MRNDLLELQYLDDGTGGDDDGNDDGDGDDKGKLLTLLSYRGAIISQ